MSGALYDNMLVVEMSSTGCEIFCCLMVSECLVVKLLLGMGGTPSLPGLLVRLVVKARERVEVIMSACGNPFFGSKG
jgi:hypothetical protein